MNFKRFVILSILLMRALLASAQPAGEPVSKSDSLRQIIDRTNDSLVIFNVLAEMLSTLEDAEEQCEMARRYYNIALYTGDSANIMNGCYRLGYYLQQAGDNSEAVDYTFRALNIAQHIGAEDIQSLCLLNIGSCYAESNLDECLRYYSAAIEVSQRVQNYTVLEDVYYNMAIFYLERNTLNLSIQYFEKARGVYQLMAKSMDGTLLEYNQTIRATRLMHYIEQKDTADIFPLLDSLNAEFCLQDSISSFAGKANFCMALCDCNIKAVDMSPYQLMANYLDWAVRYLGRLSEIIEDYNVQWLIPESYNNLKARILMAQGRYAEAGRMLMNPDLFSNQYEYNKTKYQYLKHEGKYRMALDVLYQLNKYECTMLSLQKAVDYDNLQSKREYDRLVEQMARESQQRNLEFEISQIDHHRFMWRANVLLAIVLVIIGVFLYSHHSNNKRKEMLLVQNQEIGERNMKLSSMHGQMLRQNQEIQDQSMLISRQRDELELTNLQLKDSINVGAEIQRAIIWSEQQVAETLGRSFVIFRPLHMVSGDFYWVSQMGSRRYLVVADCTGHGVPGGLLSMYAMAMMNNYVKRNPNRKAAEILEIIKEAYLSQFVRGDKDFYDGMDCAIVIFDRGSMTAQYSGARRPLVQIHDGQIIIHRPDKISIGNNPLRENARFTNHEFQIHPGDMLYAFSDGIADQFGGDDSCTKFGNSQLNDILQEVAFLDTSIQKSVIESVVDNWCSGPYYAGLARKQVPQLDDQLLIGVRV